MYISAKPPIKASNQSILVKHDKMRSFYAPHHYHSDYEIIYIKKSYGLRIIGNHINNYKAGEVVILGPGLPHFHSVGQELDGQEMCIETIAVLFPEAIFEANLQFPEFMQLQPLLEQLKYGIELEGTTKCTVQNLLEDLTIAPSLSNYINLYKILDTLADKHSTFTQLSTVKYDNKRVYDQKTKHVLDYVAAHYQDKISIEELALQSNLSKAGFCNFFKAQTGFTFTHYLNRLRVSKACELLAISHMRISEVAFAVGYDNLAYFNRKFKAIKGQSPKDFRKALLHP